MSRPNDRRSNGMVHRKRVIGTGLFVPASAVTTALILLAASAQAQGPQFDVGAPPGAAGGASSVGQPLGSANFPDPDTGPSASALISGRPGPGGTHVSTGAFSIPGVPNFRPTNLSPAPVPSIQPLPV